MDTVFNDAVMQLGDFMQYQSMITEEPKSSNKFIIGVIYYEISGMKNPHGQIIGADGTGSYVDVVYHNKQETEHTVDEVLWKYTKEKLEKLEMIYNISKVEIITNNSFYGNNIQTCNFDEILVDE